MAEPATAAPELNAFDIDALAEGVVNDYMGITNVPAPDSGASAPQVIDGLVMPPADDLNAPVVVVPEGQQSTQSTRQLTADDMLGDEGATPPKPAAPTAPTDKPVVAPPKPAAGKEGEDAEGEEETPPSYEKDEDGLVVMDPAKFPNVKFNVVDAEGDLTIPEGIAISFKADGGKLFEAMPLPQVIQYAQRGIYNQRLQDEVSEFRSAVPEIRDTLAQYQSTIEVLTQQNERLLTDDEYLYAQREALEREATPEARLERAERALRERDAAASQSAASVGVERYVDTEITPAFEQMLAKYGDHVTWEEVWGKYDQLLMPFKVNGVVPPQKIKIMGQLLTNELLPWVEATAGKRSDKAKAADVSKASDAARVLAAEGVAKRKAAEAATMARRQFVRRTGVSPVSGGGSPGQGAKPRQEVPVTSGNALDAIMEDALSNLR